MLKWIQIRWTDRNLELVVVLVLMLLAFALRFRGIDFYSLSEDEAAKWAAIEEYQHGHFAGVNSEHPMLPKVLAWGSLAAGQRWNRLAIAHHWPWLKPEGWLRLPNVAFGSLTAVVLYLLCRQVMGIPGSCAAAFFWAVAPLAIALNRLSKEETPLTFFTLLACYFYCRAQHAGEELSARRWYDLSSIGFGLALASQYILHFFGLNALAWLIAQKNGIATQPSRFRFGRFYLVMSLSFILVNPVILSPGNCHAIWEWLHHARVRHTGYDFDGILYINFPSRLLAGLPWFYYVWLLLVKTPVPILACIIFGSTLLLRDRRNLAYCYFLSLGVVQLAGLSLSGAKWIRYSLPLLPFLYLAGGHAVEQAWLFVKRRNLSLWLVGAPTMILVVAPLFELSGWTPFYSLYLNPIGGGHQKVTHYFSPDEVSEFDTREVAQEVCRSGGHGATLATARPLSMTYYTESLGRPDIHVVPLYDPQYVPQDGDFIVLEPSRRFFETQRYFDAIRNSEMSHTEVRVGPVLASTIYFFNSSEQVAGVQNEGSTIAQLHKLSAPLGTQVDESTAKERTISGSSTVSRSEAQ